MSEPLRWRPGGIELIGITAATPLIGDAWKMAKTAKGYGLTTILGGPHLTILPGESLGPEHPYVDYTFKGEAEDGILTFVEALERGEKPEDRDIPGLNFRRGDEIVVSPISPMIEDLDRLPFPAHDLFKIDRYTNLQPLTDGLDTHARSFTIITSRGCPYKCTFCSKPVTGDTWRGRSVENVVKEWRWLVQELGATEIGVTDDIWNLKLPRAKELCRRLVEEGLNTVPWVTVHGMKVNHTDPELFHLMKAAGAKRVGFGVENGDPWMLKNVIRKGQTLDMVRDAFRWAKAADLQTMGFFIFGMPRDTAETMEKTIQLALELDPDLANFMLAAPFPGTKMWDMIKEGGEVFAHEWPDYAIHDQKARFTMNEGYDPDRHPRPEGALHDERGLRPRSRRQEVARGVPALLSLPAQARVGEDVEEELLDRAAEHRQQCPPLLHRPPGSARPCPRQPRRAGDEYEGVDRADVVSLVLTLVLTVHTI